MSRFKIFNVLDIVFISLITFIICFAIIQFLIVNFILSLVLAIILSSAILFVAKVIISKKQNKQLQLNEDKLKAEINSIHFQLYSTAKKVSLLKSLINTNYQPKTVGSHIEYVKDGQKHIVLIENCTEKITLNYLLNCIKPYLSKTKNITIICNDYDQQSKEMITEIKNIKIKLINKYEFYSLCKQNNIKIEEKLIFNKNKLKIKDIFKNFFNISHFKGFFFGGIIMLLSSFIVPFRIYYLIFGIILLIFSLICKLNIFTFISKSSI